MQINILTGNNLNKARAYIPENAMNSCDLFFGYEDNEALVAVAAVLSKKDEWMITWFYVLPEYRRRGYGSAFLDALVNKGELSGVSIMTSIMDAGVEDRRYMELILARKQFLLIWESISRIRISLEQLQKAVFLTDERYKRSLHGQAKTKPLGQVSSVELKKFIKTQEEENNYLLSRADYSRADGKKSMALLVNDDIVGLILLQKEDESRSFQISLCYVDKQYEAYVVYLFKEAAGAVLLDKDNVEALEFACMDESIVKLGKHIFPEYELLKNDIVIGECWL